MWLVGVVIRRYIDILIIIINFPYSTCIRSFLAAASLLLCSFLMFFRSCIYIIYIYVHETLRPINRKMGKATNPNHSFFSEKKKELLG